MTNLDRCAALIKKIKRGPVWMECGVAYRTVFVGGAYMTEKRKADIKEAGRIAMLDQTQEEMEVSYD